MLPLNPEPNETPTPSTVEDLTVHDLARYLSFRYWGGMTAAQRIEATQHLRSKEAQANAERLEKAEAMTERVAFNRDERAAKQAAKLAADKLEIENNLADFV